MDNLNDILLTTHKITLPNDIIRIIVDFGHPKQLLLCSHCNTITDPNKLVLKDVVLKILTDSKLVLCSVCFKKYKVVKRS